MTKKEIVDLIISYPDHHILKKHKKEDLLERINDTVTFISVEHIKTNEYYGYFYIINNLGDCIFSSNYYGYFFTTKKRSIFKLNHND